MNTDGAPKYCEDTEHLYHFRDDAPGLNDGLTDDRISFG